jgi:hypothetical protein
MGFFSKPAPLDPRFTLPAVKRMDCTQLYFPCKSEMAMMNFKWLEKQMKSDTYTYQEPMILVNRIMETSDFWKQVNIINLDDATNGLVQYVMGLEALKLKEDDFAELFMAANFGLLAGLFESSSKTTSKDECHPDIWNAMTFLSSIRGESLDGTEKPGKDSAFLFICQKTCEAGYVMGKLGGLTLAEVFKRWNDVR